MSSVSWWVPMEAVSHPRETRAQEEKETMNGDTHHPRWQHSATPSRHNNNNNNNNNKIKTSNNTYKKITCKAWLGIQAYFKVGYISQLSKKQNSCLGHL